MGTGPGGYKDIGAYEISLYIALLATWGKQMCFDSWITRTLSIDLVEDKAGIILPK